MNPREINNQKRNHVTVLEHLLEVESPFLSAEVIVLAPRV